MSHSHDYDYLDCRVRLRRQRIGVAPGREGLSGSRSGVRASFRGSRLRRAALPAAPDDLCAEAGFEGHSAGHPIQGRHDPQRKRRGRREPRLRADPVASRRRILRRLAQVCGDAPDLEKYYELAEGMLGVVTQPRRTSPHDGDTGDRRGARCSRHLPASPCWRLFRRARRGTRRSVFRRRRARPGRDASNAGCACWDAATTPRTPCRRTTCGSPNASVCTSTPNAQSPRYGRWARTMGPTGMRSRANAPAPGFARTVGRRPRGRWSSPPARSGTNQLLAQCKSDGTLPRISDRLGQLVRTNSESMTAVTTPDDQGLGSKRFDHLEHASHRGQPSSKPSPTGRAETRWA